MTRVAINGFGRIGRAVFRIIAERPDSGIEVVAINDLADDDVLAYLLKYDTVMGNFEHEVEVGEGEMRTAGHTVRMLMERDITALPWGELGVDVVIESTGVFRDKASLQKHLDAGAKRVILTVPPRTRWRRSCWASTTASSTARTSSFPMPRAPPTAWHRWPRCSTSRFGIRRGTMTTVHAYTNDQRLADVPHEELRRSRAATENIIPTTTGAAKAVGLVLPELKGKLDGMAMRVPVPDGSTVDLVVELERPVTVEEVNAAIKEAASGELEGILQYSEDPLSQPT